MRWCLKTRGTADSRSRASAGEGRARRWRFPSCVSPARFIKRHGDFCRSVRLRAHLVMLIRFLRHGTTGRAEYLDGRTDHPLAAEGWAPVRVADGTRHWPTIVTSPRRRTRGSAAAAEARNLTRGSMRIGPSLISAYGMVGGKNEREPAILAPARRVLFAIPRQIRLRAGESWASFEMRMVVLSTRLAHLASHGPVSS